jgi:hypothetical protein
MTGIDTRVVDRELKKGSAELLLLSLPPGAGRTRKTWDTFVDAMRRVTGGEHA